LLCSADSFMESIRAGGEQTVVPSGLFLFDKPCGITSHDGVYKLRKKLGIKRIGHGGTLDPFASGLLILLVGSATKKQSLLQGGSKVYSGVIELGTETDTWDCTGKVVARAGIPLITPESFEKAVAGLSGKIVQQVPPFSAVKVNGRKLYELARAGESVPEIMRETTVEWLEKRLDGDEIGFRIKCSGGTYIRSIARDIGVLLGTKAHLKTLRREEAGGFHVSQAIGLETLLGMNYDEIVASFRQCDHA